jgi:hypothetical protein
LVGVVTAAGAVLLIVWMWRSAHNALALGRTGARLSPGWSIGAWFVPLANLVLLYLIYSDLWRSSDPDSPRGDGWRARPGSALVRCFWGLYVVGYALLFCAVALAVGGVVGEATTRALLVTGGALSAAAALLNILVVRDVTARQEAMQERDPAPTDDAALGGRAPLPRAIVPDDPGWYADPSGHFEHRYWDGGAWTEHVSRGGVATTAPVAPADWYPDPTGRFAWRYWTGHEWTEHASRAGDLYVDPLDGQPDGGAPEAPGSGTA